MKILIYSINYAPDVIGISKYNAEMAEWLVLQGHKVRVVTAPPYYPEWSVTTGYSNKTYSREVLSGVPIWRCPLYVPTKPTGIKRIIHLASFALSSVPVMLCQIIWRPDVVMVTEPPVFCAPMAWFSSRLMGAKCWLHVQDFELDAAFKLGLLSGDWVKRLFSLMERWLMRRFDVVSSISHSMISRLKDCGIKAPVLFPNWSDLGYMCVDSQGRQSIRRELGINDDVCLCLYSGNIAVKQGLEIVLEVAKQLPEIIFVICGCGAAKAALQEQAQTLDIKNIRFMPLQQLEQFPALLSAADIHLIIQKREAADLVMPSKLTNILAVGGVAIVTADKETELGRLAVGDMPCVFRCDPDSSMALKVAIETLRDDSGLRDRLSRSARQFAHERIDKEKVLREMLKQIEQLTS